MSDRIRGLLAVLLWWPCLLVLIWLALIVVAVIGMPENDYTGPD